MGALEDMKAKTQQVVGGAKEEVGKATGNESMEADGTKDQVVGKGKQAVEDFKEKAASVVNDLKNKVTGKDNPSE